MKATDFSTWFKALQKLNRVQRELVKNTLHLTESKQAVTAILEQTKASACPYCNGHSLYRWGKRSGLQRYRCCDCGHTFNALSDTSLAHLRHKERWLNYGQALCEGMTVREAAKACGVHKNTSFRWRHRFLKPAANIKAEHLEGIVEADETFFPYSEKGSRHLSRKAHRRGSETHQCGTGAEHVPVLILRDRHGSTADFKLEKTDLEHIKPILQERIASDAVLCSDGAAVYRSASQSLLLAHRRLNISKGIRVLGKVYHIQNVNAYDSRLKGWMKRFHGVATKYLENYLGWRRWLERSGEAVEPDEIISTAVKIHFQPLTQT
jgi:transposase-like protein